MRLPNFPVIDITKQTRQHRLLKWLPFCGVGYIPPLHHHLTPTCPTPFPGYHTSGKDMELGTRKGPDNRDTLPILWTDRQQWKHYLPATSLAIVNNVTSNLVFARKKIEILKLLLYFFSHLPCLMLYISYNRFSQTPPKQWTWHDITFQTISCYYMSLDPLIF